MKRRKFLQGVLVAGSAAKFASGKTPAAAQAKPLHSSSSARLPWQPGQAQTYRNYKIGFIHGVQYWVNPGVTAESIESDFRRMAEEDHINGARLAFWGMVPGRPVDFSLFDACFKSAARHRIILNPVLPQIPGWVSGASDDPEVRQTYREHITRIVQHYRDEPALGMWTVDIEPSRSWKAEPSATTRALYVDWLKKKYPRLEEFKKTHRGLDSFEAAANYRLPEKGIWNDFQPFIDWVSFTAYQLSEQVRFVSEIVKQIDPVHPTSATPPDVLHNQVIENGRSMWWIADTVDYPSCQLHAHWHLETADMPEDVLVGQAASVRKVYCSARDRGITYSGEVLAGPDFGESPRLYAPVAEELLATTLCHLAEGSKGYFFWVWDQLREGPNAGAWNLREPDGSPSDKSIQLGYFGRMVARHNDLLYRLRPADTHVAVFDALDAAIYLHRRSSYHPMSEWYAKNQYGFYKALRACQMGCDFIDEIALINGAAGRYACLYVPFSMCMTPEIARALRDYVAEGGTLVADCLTAFTPPAHLPDRTQPSMGLAEVLGLKATAFEIAYSGWTEVKGVNKRPNFDRIMTVSPREKPRHFYDENGKLTPLVAAKLLQWVKPTTAQITHRDQRGHAVCTVNRFGKGRAIWTGTLLGLTCRDADTPPERYRAVVDLFRRYLPESPWTLEAPEKTLVGRRLTGQGEDLFVLVNEGQHKADFKLDLGRNSEAAELLFPETPSWRKISGHQIAGSLKPLQGAVIHCPR